MTEPRILARELVIVPVGSIEPFAWNPNEGDVGAIAESIAENDFYNVILVQRSSGRIVAGEHRWRAAQAEGMAEVPVVFLDVDDERAVRINLADNRTRDRARTDESAASRILMDLDTGTERRLAGTGWDHDDLDAMLARIHHDPPVPPPDPPERTRGMERCADCGAWRSADNPRG